MLGAAGYSAPGGISIGGFVLVHPAWFGGWCWKKLVPLLEEQGHIVHTPTLTGLGERSHLAHPGILMQTHIDDVTSVLTYDDLGEVILAGTSSSGAVLRYFAFD
jgi:Alpha/beta hydrolase family